MDKITVLDFGGQYTHLIARNIRDLGIYAEVKPSEAPYSELKDAKGIVLSGGPKSVYEADAPKFDPELFSGEIPILGICYGMQLMAQELGGKVAKGWPGESEYGKKSISIQTSRLFEGLNENETVWMSHGDYVEDLPKGFRKLASSDNVTAAIGDDSRRYYGTQFHPEVTHTEKGKVMLGNFVQEICGCESGSWTMEGCIDKAIARIRGQVGNGYALVFASGGIDSTVAAFLSLEALGPEKVKAVHIDNGLLRKDESKKVMEVLEKLGLKVKLANYSEKFLGDLRYVKEPEEKRRIIGDDFAEIFDRELVSFDGDIYLVQGTLYTDRIESARGIGIKADVIKTHHNVGSEKIRKLKDAGKVVEPNDDLYKDEVRKIGELLGLPEDVVWRHPFPGPGLAIRIICDVNIPQNFDEMSGEVWKLARELELEGYVYPIRTVGVQGDARTYKNLAMLTGKRDWNAIRKAASKIVNEVPGINRVLYTMTEYDLSQNSMRFLRRLDIDERNLYVLREADDIAHRALEKYGLYKTINQMPVVIFPGNRKPLVAIRDVVTDNFMTARPAEKPKEMPWECVEEIAEGILTSDEIEAHGGIELVGLDVTDKPPATIEWE